jgi:hypothetical protein
MIFICSKSRPLDKIGVVFKGYTTYKNILHTVLTLTRSSKLRITQNIKSFAYCTKSDGLK